MSLISKSILLVSLLCGSLLLYGQETERLSDIIPPSPEASALGKYGDIPVSYQTGTPSIAVPIHSFSGRHLSLDMILSYHASGIRVDEVASWVGLGWSLHAGGSISRVVRGIPDEVPNGYYRSYPVLKYYLDTVGLVHCNNNQLDSLHDLYCDTYMKEAIGNIHDTKPDEYIFTIGDYSGRFYINPVTKEVLISPYQDLKVEYFLPTSSLEYVSWIVTLPNGTKYYFNELQSMELSDVGMYSNSMYPSTWYPSRITDANEIESIEFSYAVRSQSQKTPYYVSSIVSASHCGSSYNTGIQHKEPTEGIYQSRQLNSITHRNIKDGYIFSSVSFGTSANREDTSNEVVPDNSIRLDAITIQHAGAITGPSNLQWEFRYSYKGNGHSKRMFLKEVQRINQSHGGIGASYTEKPYKFEYNETLLPVYGSKAKDHWGYYNGAISNTTLLTFDPAIHSNLAVNPANRKANIYLSTAGMLSKIYYPTGGYSSFEFEGHESITKRRADGEFATATAFVRAHANDNQHGIMNQLELHFRGLWDDGDTQIGGGMPNVKAYKFNIEVSGGVTVKSSFKLLYDGVSNGTSEINAQAPNGVYLYKLNNGTLPSKWENFLFQLTTVEQQRYLDPGEYVLVAAIGVRNTNFSLEGKLTYQYQIGQGGTVVDNNSVGGGRIKTIIHHDGIDHRNDQRLDFHYIRDYIAYLNQLEVYQANNQSIPLTDPCSILFAEDGTPCKPLYIPEEQPFPQSSMLLTGRPVYEKQLLCGVLISASNVDAFGTWQGGHVSYSEVTITNNAGANGYTVYKYYRFPGNQNKVAEEQYYDSSRKLLKDTKYEYNFPNNNFAASIMGYELAVLDVKSIGSFQGSNQVYNIYQYHSRAYGQNWVALTSKLLTSYFSESTFVVKEMIEYAGIDYNQPHTRPTRTLSLSSDDNHDEGTFVAYTYASDYPDNSIANALSSRNMINIPLEVRKGKLINGLEYTHDLSLNEFSLASGLLLPESTHKVEFHAPGMVPVTSGPQNSSLFRNSLIYLPLNQISYDALGKPIVSTYLSGETESILWGYKGRFPVLKGLGATPDRIAYAGFESEIVNGGWNYSAASVTENSAYAGNKALLLNAPIHFSKEIPADTYILRFWCKGTPPIINLPQNKILNLRTEPLSDGAAILIYELQLQQGDVFSISGSSQVIDEVVLLPISAQAETFSFSSSGLMETKTDMNGRLMRYLYDGYGRLVEIEDENGNLLSQFKYQFRD